MRRPALGGRTRLVVFAVAGLLVAGTAATGVLVASDHQDTPFVEFNQRFDVNDVYVFPSSTPGRTVLVLGTSSPLTPASTPSARFGNVNEVLYQIKIDNNGDAKEDLVIQATFEDRPNEQRVTVVGPGKPNSVGTANTLISGAARTVTGRTDRVLTANNIQVYAGPRDDPFFIDLEQFFRIVPDRRPASGPLSQLPSTPSASSFRDPANAADYVRGLNDLAIVVEVPTSMLTGDNGQRTRLGVWGTTSKRRTNPGTT